MQEVTHFCLPELLPILKNSVQVVNQVCTGNSEFSASPLFHSPSLPPSPPSFRQMFGFYEEFLSCRFPYSSYKLVFVDKLCVDYTSYSTLGLFDTSLLHSARMIDQAMATRRLISRAVAEQYFGCYVLQQSW